MLIDAVLEARTSNVTSLILRSTTCVNDPLREVAVTGMRFQWVAAKVKDHIRIVGVIYVIMLAKDQFLARPFGHFADGGVVADRFGADGIFERTA